MGTNSINHELHDKDFYAWTRETAQLLKNGKISEVDAMNVAEEIDDMGASIKRAVLSQLRRLIKHLLKWKYQSELRSNSWKNTIEDSREEIADLVLENHTLDKELQTNFDKIYKKSLRDVSSETGLEKRVFPETCPFTLEQCLDNDFFPE